MPAPVTTAPVMTQPVVPGSYLSYGPEGLLLKTTHAMLAGWLATYTPYISNVDVQGTPIQPLAVTPNDETILDRDGHRLIATLVTVSDRPGLDGLALVLFLDLTSRPRLRCRQLQDADQPLVSRFMSVVSAATSDLL